jgi:hypothetical protein
MSHHDIPNSRYNVFLPLFDLLFVSTGGEETKCLFNLQETGRPLHEITQGKPDPSGSVRWLFCVPMSTLA